MYNESYKKKYIEENSDKNLNLELYITREFDKIASYEERLGKDLYDFTTHEIMLYYKQLATPSFETLQVLNNQFKIYTTEAMTKSLLKDNQNHYNEITPDLLITCINSGLAQASIVTRDELCDIIDHMDNACDAFFILALFEGIRGKENIELIELYTDNFDHDTMSVELVTGRKLKISSKLYGLAMESAKCYEYAAKNGAVKGFRADDARIIKMIKRADNVDSLHNRCCALQKSYRRIKASTDLMYTMSTIVESGRIDYIKRLMKESGLTLNECLSQYRSDIEFRYGGIQCLSTYVLKYGKYFE